MANELRTEYKVVITQEGDGANQAAKQLQNLQNTAAGVGKSTENANATLVNLNATTKAATSGLKLLQGAAVVVGLQSFPQLATAGLLVRDALQAMKVTTVSATASLGVTGAAVAGLTAIVTFGIEAFITYKAKKEEAFSVTQVQGQTERFTESLRNQIQELYRLGQITRDTFEDLNRQLFSPNAGGNSSVRQFIESLQHGNAQQQIADLERSMRYSDLVTGGSQSPNFREGAEGRAFAEANLNQQYKDRIELYKNLRSQGLITEHDLMTATQEADIQRVQGLQAIKRELTDVQQVERSAAETFASGLAKTLVDVKAWKQDAGKAFGEFFQQLTQQIAQLIIQMLILRALKAAFPSLFPAAQGGIFPRMMAAGGLQGVQQVSSPTYFPNFNVMAGEAGREMMAVLARPRFMEVGGIQAVVGQAGGNRLAISSADDLARRGGAGQMTIHVQMDPGLHAQIVEDSIEGAAVRITKDLSQDSQIRRAVKKVSG